MDDYAEAIDDLTAQLGALRALRNTLLVHRQVVSGLDTELSSLELRLGFLSRSTDSYDFFEQHERIQNAMNKTAKTWFA